MEIICVPKFIKVSKRHIRSLKLTIISLLSAPILKCEPIFCRNKRLAH